MTMGRARGAGGPPSTTTSWFTSRTAAATCSTTRTWTAYLTWRPAWSPPRKPSAARRPPIPGGRPLHTPTAESPQDPPPRNRWPSCRVSCAPLHSRTTACWTSSPALAPRASRPRKPAGALCWWTAPPRPSRSHALASTAWGSPTWSTDSGELLGHWQRRLGASVEVLRPCRTRFRCVRLRIGTLPGLGVGIVEAVEIADDRDRDFEHRRVGIGHSAGLEEDAQLLLRASAPSYGGVGKETVWILVVGWRLVVSVERDEVKQVAGAVDGARGNVGCCLVAVCSLEDQLFAGLARQRSLPQQGGESLWATAAVVPVGASEELLQQDRAVGRVGHRGGDARLSRIHHATWE